MALDPFITKHLQYLQGNQRKNAPFTFVVSDSVYLHVVSCMYITYENY